MAASGYSFERRFTFEGDASSDDEHSTRQEASQQLADFFDVSQRAWFVVCQRRVHHRTSGQAMWRDMSSHRLELPKRCAEWTQPASPDSRFELGRSLIQIPAREKHTMERTTIEIPVMPLHESIAEEQQMNPKLSFQLRESLENHEWTMQYHQHPIVRGAAVREQVWPLALYVDGVPFQKQFGVLAATPPLGLATQ